MSQFEDLKLERFQCLSMNYWIKKDNNFKKAAETHALIGIVLNSILILLHLSFYSVMLPNLTHLLVVAIVFLTESIILLKRINNNDGEGVFKMIKIASGTLAALNLLQGITFVIFTIHKGEESDLSTWNLIFSILNLTLTTLGVFGIWKRNTKLFSVFIIYSYIQSLIVVYFLLLFLENFQFFMLFLPFLFIAFWKFSLRFSFVLHLNVINFSTQTETEETAESIGLQQV